MKLQRWACREQAHERRGGAGNRRCRLPGLASMCAAAAREIRCRVRGQFLHRHASDNIAHLLSQSQLRIPAPRRDVSALCRGRPDLQSGLPRLAHPLPARSGADDEDQRARRHQHAWPGQAPARAHLPGVDRRKCTAIPSVHPQREEYWGHVNPIGSAFVLRRRQTLRRDAVLRLPSPAQTGDQGRAHLQHYGPRMHPNDGRVVSNFIVQALQGRGHHALRRWQRRHARSAMSTI